MVLDQCDGRGSRIPHPGGPVHPVEIGRTECLNYVAIVFEIEITPDGTYHDRMGGWK